MTSSFGMLALAIAAVGIYGIMAYSVASRTNEIGIRLALGALPRQVLAMVLREAVWISLAGIAVGLTASLVLARLVKRCSMDCSLPIRSAWFRVRFC
jgi:ABC-type antimicrobial peptide transport system permease subunit